MATVVTGTDAVAVALTSLPLESLDGLPEDALCMICQGPSVDNVSMCLTGHNACRGCADQAVRHSNKCPGCRETVLRPGDKWMANTALNNLVKDFKVKCPNACRGCTEECRAVEMTAHIAGCDFREVCCIVPGCNWKGAICDQDAHMKDDDHGRFLVHTVLSFNAKFEELHKSLAVVQTSSDALKSSITTEYQPAVAALDLRLNAMNQCMETQRATLQTIEQQTKKRDGSSARTARRDKQYAADVAAANSSKEDAVAAKNSELACKDKDIDERKQELAQVSERKRKLETDLGTANRRIHDQHAILAKMMPHAASRTCPCALCMEDGEVAPRPSDL